MTGAGPRMRSALAVVRGSASVRWGLVLLVVVVGLIVAIVPEISGDASDGGSTAVAVSGAPAAAADAAAVQAARASAALQPCPTTGSGPGPSSSPMSSSSLSGVTVACLGGGPAVDLGSALAGTPTVLNLWAAWCGPCRIELPVLAAYQAAVGGAVRVLTVHAQDGAQNPTAALGLLRDLGVHLPAVLDTDGAVAAAVHAPPALPVTALIRTDGTVATVLPTVFADVAAVRRAVATYLDVRA